MFFADYLATAKKFWRIFAITCLNMALYKYFKSFRKATSSMPLPDPNSLLSKEVDTETIKELNKEIGTLVNSGTMGKRSTYLKMRAEQKATMGKYAAEHGIINAIQHFTGEFPEGALKESTVHGWKKAYLVELHLQRRAGKDLLITELPTKKLGHPLLLGETLEKELRAYLIDLGKAGRVVNAEIAMASAKGLVRRKDSRLLAENGGYMVFTKDWAHHLLARMGLVKRKANSKVKITADDFDKLKEHFFVQYLSHCFNGGNS